MNPEPYNQISRSVPSRSLLLYYCENKPESTPHEKSHGAAPVMTLLDTGGGVSIRGRVRRVANVGLEVALGILGRRRDLF